VRDLVSDFIEQLELDEPKASELQILLENHGIRYVNIESTKSHCRWYFFFSKYFKIIKKTKNLFRNSVCITHIYYICCGTKALNVSKKLQNMDIPRK